MKQSEFTYSCDQEVHTGSDDKTHWKSIEHENSVPVEKFSDSFSMIFDRFLTKKAQEIDRNRLEKKLIQYQISNTASTFPQCPVLYCRIWWLSHIFFLSVGSYEIQLSESSIWVIICCWISMNVRLLPSSKWRFWAQRRENQTVIGITNQIISFPVFEHKKKTETTIFLNTNDRVTWYIRKWHVF